MRFHISLIDDILINKLVVSIKTVDLVSSGTAQIEETALLKRSSARDIVRGFLHTFGTPVVYYPLNNTFKIPIK